MDHSLKKKLFSGSVLLSYNPNVWIAFCKASAIFYLHTVIGMVGFVLCCFFKQSPVDTEAENKILISS